MGRTQEMCVYLSEMSEKILGCKLRKSFPICVSVLCSEMFKQLSNDVTDW